MNNSQSLGIILEEIRDQNKAALEAVSDIRRIVDNQPTREEFDELKSDVKVVKAAIVYMSNEQKLFDQRLAKLEAV